MNQLVISREDTSNKGRYAGRINDVQEEAELTFSRDNATLIIADHTYVPESMRGTGMGKALVTRLIEDARKEGFKIIPLCPFVKAQFARNPDWSDVMQG